MSHELFIGVNIAPEVLAISVLEGKQEHTAQLPHTALGWQAIVSLLRDFAANYQVALAISGQRAVETALQLPCGINMQVFMVAAMPYQQASALALYARHAA